MLKNSIIINFVKLLKGSRIKSYGGRNNTGVITAFHRGGANKTRYRYIDFWRKVDSVGGVISISYDPGRSALLASVFYFNGYISSIVATKTLTIGSRVFSGGNLVAARDIYFSNSERAKDTYKRKIYACGNAFTLSIIPVGSTVNCVELYKSYGAQLVRSAGAFALLYRKTLKFAYLKLRSGWRVVLPLGLMATIGTVSNVSHQTIILRTAGKNRAKGLRPVVRGVAMNPVDHPHGGGQGHTSGGPKPKSPWGKLTKWRATVSKRVRKQKQLVRFFLET